MDYDKLRADAALIAFGALLHKSEARDDGEFHLIAHNAWAAAEDFIENRPCKCIGCISDLPVDVPNVCLDTKRAGPKIRKDNNPAKPKRRK
ncbi:MAG: hypothetical protein LBH43_20785 [Treponema sp.]|jgi:hypothetical protein|nr:hypothetical protein [Treponema sp.]